MLSFCKILIICQQSTQQNQSVERLLVREWHSCIRVISVVHPVPPVLVPWA